MVNDFQEDVLPDDYPVFRGYWYVVGGIPMRSPIRGIVAELKSITKEMEIRRCDAVKRGLKLV